MKFSKVLASILTAILVVSCESTPDPSGESSEPEPRAMEYRLYYDASRRPGDYQVRHFEGQLMLADLEPIFGNIGRLRRDGDGNGSAAVEKDGTIYSIKVSPDLKSVNLVSKLPDGTISSAFDFDGDRRVDLLDTRLPDDRRHLFANELGRLALTEWLRNNDPLCAERFWAQVGAAGLNCPSDGSGGSSGSGGVGIADPFEAICAEYRNRPNSSFNKPVYSHGGHGYGRAISPRGYHWVGEGDTRGKRIFVAVTVIRDDAGNHVSTLRETRYYDTAHEGYLVRTTRERVSHDGQGTRTVTDHHGDGTSTSTTTSFETEVDDEGRYPVKDFFEEPQAPPGYDAYPDDTYENIWPPMSGSPVTGPGSNRGDPGPVDPGTDDSWEVWCTETDSSDFQSGAEAASNQDLSIYRNPICPVGGPRSGNCIKIPAASIREFDDIVEAPPAAGGCGRFEQPGPDGTCGPASRIDMLGAAAWIAEAKIGGIIICNPIVCTPPE